MVENAKNIKNDLPLHLANAFLQFELYSMEALNKTFGDKATDYLAKNKWIPSELEEGEEVGDATDLFMSNKIKEIEATKLLYNFASTTCTCDYICMYSIIIKLLDIF